MIIYIAPKDTEMREKTLGFAKSSQVRMVDVEEGNVLGLEDANKGKAIHYAENSYRFGDAETIWIVGHGNEDEIGDKSKGVTMTAKDLVSLLVASVIANANKYHGSIVIDTCKSGSLDGKGTTFADRVYEQLKIQLPKATVGGWKGNVSGPISGGKVVLNGQALQGEAGFVWGGGVQPNNGDHTVLANLAR
jgi:hypothetical protein